MKSFNVIQKIICCVSLGMVFWSDASTEVYKVNPVPGQSTWTTLRRMGILFDETTPIPLFNSDIVAGVLSLSEPGNYQVAEDLDNCSIVISADGVSLDLKKHKIINVLAPTLVVLGRSQIRVRNGYMLGGGSNIGIDIQLGSSKVLLEDLTLSYFFNGVRFSGSQSRLARVNTLSCAHGMYFIYAYSNNIKECCALYCTVSGFELFESEMNCFYACSALKTIGAGSVAGFKTTQGVDNLFQRCVAQQTATNTALQGDTACGFVLTGTEQKTKLLGCVVNATSVLNSDAAVTCGINQAPVLLSAPDVLSTLTSTSFGNAVGGCAWSPNNTFVAVSVASSNSVYIYRFNGATLALVTSLALTSPSRADWSPDGKFLTVVNNAGTKTVRVYAFNGNTLSLAASSAALSGFGYAPQWSPNGKFIAVGDSALVPAYVRNYTFDGSSLVEVGTVIIPSAGVGNSVRLAWSPDSSALAVSADGVFVLNVFGVIAGSFGSGATFATTGSVLGVSWSPNGRYIVIADNGARVARVIRWLPTDASPLMQVGVTPVDSSPLDSVQWSPDGNYFVYGTSAGAVKLFYFYGSSIFFMAMTAPFSSTVTDLAWSADGRFVMAGSYDKKLFFLRAMYGPENCLIDACTVGNTLAIGQNLGRGFVGAGSSVFTRNKASNNAVNYSYGIPNVYEGTFDLSAHRNVVQPFDNISLPILS